MISPLFLKISWWTLLFFWKLLISTRFLRPENALRSACNFVGAGGAQFLCFIKQLCAAKLWLSALAPLTMKRGKIFE